jgi:hypothetical protein
MAVLPQALLPNRIRTRAAVSPEVVCLFVMG